MTPAQGVLLAIATLLFFFLAYAMIKPEKF
jgi:K+-transporting ATPase KdpF subunit